MNRSQCEAVLYLHRNFLPRRRTGRGFLTGTVFLDAALLFAAFVLSISPFVLKPGIELELPIARQTDAIRYTDSVLAVTQTGLFFFNDEILPESQLEPALRVAAGKHPGSALILEADASMSQAVAARIYDAAAQAGFSRVFIATRPGPPPMP